MFKMCSYELERIGNNYSTVHSTVVVNSAGNWQQSSLAIVQDGCHLPVTKAAIRIAVES